MGKVQSISHFCKEISSSSLEFLLFSFSSFSGNSMAGVIVCHCSGVLGRCFLNFCFCVCLLLSPPLLPPLPFLPLSIPPYLSSLLLFYLTSSSSSFDSQPALTFITNKYSVEVQLIPGCITSSCLLLGNVRGFIPCLYMSYLIFNYLSKLYLIYCQMMHIILILSFPLL